MRKIILLVLASCLTVPALAASSGPTINYTTFGNVDCGRWIAEKNPNKKGWVLGMLTGINFQHEAEHLWPADPLGKLDSAEQAFLWVDNYCKAHPLDKVSNAVVDLFNALWRK